MKLNRTNPLRASLLAHFGCQLARRYIGLIALGQPSMIRLAADLSITAREYDQIEEEATTDWDVWAISAGADVPTLVAAKALSWMESWSRWGRLGDFDVQALSTTAARDREEESISWMLPAVRDLLVDSMKAAQQAGWDAQDA